MKLFISPTHKVDWRINTIFFLESIKYIYKNIRIQKITNPQRPYLYTWQVNDDNYFLEGSLSKDLNSIVFTTNNLHESLDFLKLCRICMPADENIIIYDEMYNNHLTLLINQNQQIENIDEILSAF